eukprot:9616288-Lingulodinium_polyedra.AAC.1
MLRHCSPWRGRPAPEEPCGRRGPPSGPGRYFSASGPPCPSLPVPGRRASRLRRQGRRPGPLPWPL